MVGIGEFSIALVMSVMGLTSPPGVSSKISRACEPFPSAIFNARAR